MEKKQAVWIGSVLGLGIMVIATPALFKVLMKRGLEERIANLKKEGIELQFVKDKSGYFQTDRIYQFRVKRDGEEWKGVVEIQYLNLPITSVDLNWTISQYTPPMEEPPALTHLKIQLWQGMRGRASSRDLQHFTYQIEPIKKPDLNLSQVSGKLYLESKEKYSYQMGLDKLSLQLGDLTGIVTNYEQANQIEPKQTKIHAKGNFTFQSGEVKLYLGNLVRNSTIYAREPLLSGDTQLLFSTFQLEIPGRKFVATDGEIDVKLKNCPVELVTQPGIGRGDQILKRFGQNRTAMEWRIKLGQTALNGEQLGDAESKMGLVCASIPNYELAPCNLHLQYRGSVKFTQNIVTPMLGVTPLQKYIPLLFQKEGDYYKLSFTLDGVSGQIKLNNKPLLSF